jgi:ribosomal protein S13
MAAVTSTLVALGGVGLSAAQAIKANKDMKKASSQYDLAQANLKKIKEINQFKSVQVPKLGFELAQQGQDQQSQQAIAALQGTGAEGIIGGIGQLVGAGNEAYLQQSAMANKAESDIALETAAAGQGIEARRADREYNIGVNEAMDANMRRSQAESNRNQAIGSAFSALGTAAGGIDKMVGLYKDSPLDQTALGSKQWNPNQFNQFGKVGGQDVDFEALGKMPNDQLKSWWKSLNPSQKKMLYND